MAAFPLDDSLWPEEKELVKWMVAAHDVAFAWEESERGNFGYDYFPPVEIPTVEHIPWVQKNVMP